jgi:prepilin-type N-terminal cleavage/methylation domain-containing protein
MKYSSRKRTFAHARRRGYSLPELLVGLVLLGIVAALFTRLLVSQARFFDLQSQSNAARNVSRGPINRVVSDLRMVEAEGGVLAASASQVTVRVPYAIGVVCQTLGTPLETEVTLLPVDSVMYNAPGFYGYAWRDNATGHYTYVENGTAVGPKQVSGACTSAGITNLNNGPRISLTPALPAAATLGTPVMLFRRVKYEFKGSQLVPGSVGLFRTVIMQNGDMVGEELAAPFAPSASFGFYYLKSAGPSATPPADLTTLRGFELHLDGMSERTPSGKTARATTPFTTAVFFKNRVT